MQKSYHCTWRRNKTKYYHGAAAKRKIGLRVGEITAKTHLSRPAVSHHLQILRNAKIIEMRKKGTMNFYYMSTDKTEWSKLKKLICHIDEIIHNASEQNYPDNHLGKDEN